MKLENESGSGLSTSPRKSYNPFVSDDDDDTSDSKPENRFAKDDHNGFDLKGFEKNTNTITFHLDNDDFLSILDHPPIADHAFITTVNGEENLYRKDTESYIDKNVTECELPELVVCYKDSSPQSVKDIGIDKGVEDFSVFLAHNSRSNCDLMREKEDQDLPILESRSDSLDDMKIDDPPKVDQLKRDVAKKGSFLDMCNVGEEAKSDELVYEVGDKNNASETNASTNFESDSKKTNEQDCDIKKLNRNGVSEQKSETGRVCLTQESRPSPSSFDVTEANTRPSEDPNEDSNSSSDTAKLHVATQTTNTNVASTLSYNSKVDSGSITLDFNSSNACSGIKESEKPPETQTMNRDEVGGSNRILDQRVHGETGFFSGIPPAASITFTGPVTYSGSTSLRSESSMGSTRSFAFPVLQTEWNSSPVRMAKADQRHFPKHKGWIHSIMCCRF